MTPDASGVGSTFSGASELDGLYLFLKALTNSTKHPSVSVPRKREARNTGSPITPGMTRNETGSPIEPGMTGKKHGSWIESRMTEQQLLAMTTKRSLRNCSCLRHPFVASKLRLPRRLRLFALTAPLYPRKLLFSETLPSIHPFFLP